MERKYPSKESPRRLLTKLGNVMDMKRLTHQFSLAAAESDKESGFSDGSSEVLSSVELTNSENMLNALCWNTEDGPWQYSLATSNSFPALSHVVIMKNVLVKQGSSSSQLQSWTVQPSFEVIPGQPQLVFLHPAISSPINPHLFGEKRSDSTNYLPILNSYTKTAPHPSKRDRGWDLEERGRTSGQKWLCTDTAMSNKTSLLPSSACPQVSPDFKPAQDSTQQSSPALMADGKMSTIDGFQYISTAKQKAPGLIPFPPTGLLQISDRKSPEMENPVHHMVQLATCSPPLAAEELYTTPELLLQQQRKRFQNTFVVLHRSGLLEITLKTKELIHQNQVTQIELDRLKQQTQLFMEAIKSNAPQAWAELEASLTGSDKAHSSLEASPTYPNM
ncbi:LOW QUALITY PROTEIN: CLOCK-interacting pacemaker [Emys orbicularis]|uniref:LOW QUALITY PROTEIN: CLOCK-interacting pacemaker n=1 Tax=Emys orbicularis TaxID=82168 RepID=UPI0031FDB460